MKNEIYNDDSSRNLPDSDGYPYFYYKSLFLELQKAYTSLENDYIQLEEKYYHYQNKIYSSQIENEEPKKILGTKKSKDTLEINLENQAINPKINQLNDMILNDTNKAEVIAEKNKKIINLEEEIKRLKETIESNQKIMNEKDYKIESLENQINSNNKSQSNKINELNKKYNDLLNQLQKEKEEKAKLISEKKEIEIEKEQQLQIKEKLKDMQKDYKELRMENENLKKELENNQIKINELEHILKEKKGINNLNEKELLNNNKLNDKEEKGLNINNKENRINDNPKNNDNIIDKINNLNNDDGRIYSYDCTNSIHLSEYIYKGTDEVVFKIDLKNNGNETWANDSKLLVDPTSDFVTDNIILNPQKANEENHYVVTIKDLKYYPTGEYKIIFQFYSGGKIHGEKIGAKIKIKEKVDANKEINENIDKIKEFRNTFNLDEDEFSDEKLFNALKENNFDCGKAFDSLYH